MADDCSPNPQIAKLLEGYALKDPRIKVTIRKENGHISAASNSALELATGEYILFMDHDDLLTANCCFEVVKHINKKPDLSDIIYSDEDKIDGNGHYSVPHFKPDWAPHNLLSRNYLGHIVVVKKDLVDQVKGFRLGFEGSQDYDILLRLTELTDKIGHIPKVLYHWRIHELSAAQSEEVKPYAYIAAKKALEEALIRRNTPGEVQYLSGLRGYRILYNVIKPGKVSIIIPTKDQTNLLRNAIDSIITKTNYSDYEIIVLNNNSNTKEFFDLMDHYSKTHPTVFRCIEANFPFNFSRLMNVGVSHANGDYILFLNNDVEVIQEDWMTRMVSFAQHKNTGIVGCKLLYPDDTIQHAGVIVGLGGVAGHSFVHFTKTMLATSTISSHSIITLPLLLPVSCSARRSIRKWMAWTRHLKLSTTMSTSVLKFSTRDITMSMSPMSPCTTTSLQPGDIRYKTKSLTHGTLRRWISLSANGKNT
jgi:glycosyltransferase involved in cell wall biosynthesis